MCLSFQCPLRTVRYAIEVFSAHCVRYRYANEFSVPPAYGMRMTAYGMRLSFQCQLRTVCDWVFSAHWRTVHSTLFQKPSVLQTQNVWATENFAIHIDWSGKIRHQYRSGCSIHVDCGIFRLPTCFGPASRLAFLTVLVSGIRTKLTEYKNL
jgi:hypothetical protein